MLLQRQPCYISSLYSSQALISEMIGTAAEQSGSLNQAVTLFQEKFSLHVLPEGEAAFRQRSWDDISSLSRYQDLPNSTNHVNRARLQTVPRQSSLELVL